jgi:hypothetical protein
MNKTTLEKILTDCEISSEQLKEYDIIVLAHDKFLSGWGNGLPENHTQAVLCHDKKDAFVVMDNMSKKSAMMSRVRFHYLSNFAKKSIKNISINFNLFENCPVWNK